MTPLTFKMTDWSYDGEKCIFISIYSKKIYFQTGNAEQSMIVVLDSLGNKQEDDAQDIIYFYLFRTEADGDKSPPRHRTVHDSPRTLQSSRTIQCFRYRSSVITHASCMECKFD